MPQPPVCLSTFDLKELLTTYPPTHLHYSYLPTYLPTYLLRGSTSKLQLGVMIRAVACSALYGRLTSRE